MLGEELWPCINERLFLLVRGSVFSDDWFDNGAAVRRGLELLLLRGPEKGGLCSAMEPVYAVFDIAGEK